ncbi:MAG: hypothetical protein R3B06_29120 [Kofleriaceae bacterium]
MRFGTLAVAASAVVHAGVLGVLALVDEPPPPRRPPPVAVSIEVAPSPPPPPRLTVRLVAPVTAPTLSPPPQVAAPPPAPRSQLAPPPAPAHTTPAPGPAALATSGAGPTSGEVPGPAVAPGTGPATGDGSSGLLDMRGPGRVDLSPRAVVAHVDIDPGAPPPPAIRPTGELTPSGGGTFRADKPGFVADIARDGRVTFKDKPAFSFHLKVPNPKDLARGLERWFEDPMADAAKGAVPLTREQLAVGDDAPGNKPQFGGTVPVAGGTMELTDWVMRHGGIDPYASAKRAFLDRTRDERAALRSADDRRLLKDTTQTIRKHLAQVWARGEVDAATRRAQLFELWDDAVEDGSDAEREAGDAARAAVIGFIRAHLPADGPDAYTAAELAALNAHRLSRARFAPY